MTTGASRPRGKFGGKFGGTSSSSSQKDNLLSTSSSTKSTDVNSTNSKKKDAITMDMVQEKRSKIRRNDVFDKLDTAEKLVLDLIHITKETTQGLHYLAKEVHDDDQNEDGNIVKDVVLSVSHDENDTTSTVTTASAATLKKQDHWKKKIKHNGKLYMDKLKNIHDLLLPHKDLIVNYGPIQYQDLQKQSLSSESKNDDQDKGGTNNNGNNDDRKSCHGRNKDDSSSKNFNTNMYESRLEMKLAIQKRNLLRDLIKLEKTIIVEENGTKNDEEMSNTCGTKHNYNIAHDDDVLSNKRKREE